MARLRQRVRLEDGHKLDLNKLVRDACWPGDSQPCNVCTQWTSNIREEFACALVTIQKEGENRGYIKLVLVGEFEQWLDIVAQPRHFGGRQWYFVCPVTRKKCSVVWLPPGAERFGSRQTWGKQVAYATQFEAPFNRAISAREKVKSRLIGDLNPREWDLPPKPKWMRWDTYERLAEKYRSKQGIIDQCIAHYLG